VPFLPLQDAEIKKLAKLPSWGLDGNYDTKVVANMLAKAGNGMGTARHCNLARLISTLLLDQSDWSSQKRYLPDVIQILTWVVSLYYSVNTFLTHLKTPSLLTPHSLENFKVAVLYIKFITNKSSEGSLILPEDFIEELRHAGLVKNL